MSFLPSPKVPCTWRCFLCFAALLTVAWILGCSAGETPTTALLPPTSPTNQLAVSDTQVIIRAAAESGDAPFVIAVTDRSGNILAVYRKVGAPVTVAGDFGVAVSPDELAIS